MIIKRKLLLSAGLLFLSALSYRAKAQFYVGLEAGSTQNYLITNVSDLISTEYVHKNGFTIAVPVEYKVNDWFTVKAAPGFIQKNYRMQRTGYYQGIYEETKNDYLQLPVSAKFSFGGRKVKGFVELGGYAAYWTSSWIKGTMPNIINTPPFYTPYKPVENETIFNDIAPYDYNEKYQFNSIKDNRLEMGLMAGIGVTYKLCDKYDLFTTVSYYEGLTDMQKNYQQEQDPRYNETGSISIGVLRKVSFGCKGRKKHLIHKTNSSK